MKLRDISGMKVCVLRAATIETNIKFVGDPIVLKNPLSRMEEPEAILVGNGTWRVYPGYMCDGPSGPTKDDSINRQPALWHDIGYQALRQGEQRITRKQVDDLMYEMLKANVETVYRRDLAGARNVFSRMWVKAKHRALQARFAIWYKGLRWFAFRAARKTKQESKYTVINCL